MFQIKAGLSVDRAAIFSRFQLNRSALLEKGRQGTLLPWRTDVSELCFSSQAAQIVLISLFELNTPEFTMLLGALPKTFQDGATKLLHNHLKNSSNTGVVSALVVVWLWPAKWPSPSCSADGQPASLFLVNSLWAYEGWGPFGCWHTSWREMDLVLICGLFLRVRLLSHCSVYKLSSYFIRSLDLS